MPKTKKSKAPLETKAESLYWKELARNKTGVTLRLHDLERLSGRALFATEESIAIETPEGETRLVPREDVAYLEESA